MPINHLASAKPRIREVRLMIRPTVRALFPRLLRLWRRLRRPGLRGRMGLRWLRLGLSERPALRFGPRLNLPLRL